METKHLPVNWVKEGKAGLRLCPLMQGACRGAQCMGWRFATYRDIRTQPCKNPRAMIAEEAGGPGPDGWDFFPYVPEELPEAAHWCEPDAQQIGRQWGYCGMAGNQGDPA